MKGMMFFITELFIRVFLFRVDCFASQFKTARPAR